MATIMVVGKMPDSKIYRARLIADLDSVGLDTNDMYFASALKCLTFEQNPSNADVKACRLYLEQEILDVRPQYILALGNEALQSLTGRSGITTYRSRILDHNGIPVIPTISPSAAKRNPGQRGSFISDLRFFAAQVNGIAAKAELKSYTVVDTKEKLRQCRDAIAGADLISFDVETHGRDEFDPVGGVVSLSFTLETRGRVTAYAIPLDHPESVWRRIWQRVIAYLAKAFGKPKRRIAHNGKFDVRWLRRYGMPTLTFTFDTLVAAHMLDENRMKGLKPQATSRLGVAPWSISTKDLLAEPIKKVLEYNVLDTFYTYHIYLELRKELKAEPRLLKVFQYLMMPGTNDLIGTEMRGIWCDRERLHTRGIEARKRLEYIERQLMKFVPTPEECSEYPKDRRGRPLAPNFNRSNFAVWWLFEYLEMPVLARGRSKPDGGPGDPSMAEAVLLEWRESHPHPVVDLLLERVKWNKTITSFFNAYSELIDDEDRIRTTFKLTGTVTGRLSSGKADEEKITASRDRHRGVNMQQVPRDEFIRGLFGAAPGYAFVEADFSQIEMRIAFFIAREEHGLELYRRGVDLHLNTAVKVLGVHPRAVTKEVRKKAKPVNFGFLYGMGWAKFIITAFNNYGVRFIEDEARAYRKAYFAEFPGLLRWHGLQRRLVRKYKQVASPIGRIRHLPDIDSDDEAVQHEAERQAINSPVQSFASDLALIGMILINRAFKRHGIDGYVLGLVHDAINFEIKEEDLPRALPIIKDIMENPPLEKWFGVNLDVPIVADIKVGKHWGGARELTPEEVYNYAG
jgi:uracil-DNA glycosylase family 4